ncbi:MAG: quinone-dependent dihydroorotate dehydrogenase [Candidatus Peregrinibacteria bacterium]
MKGLFIKLRNILIRIIYKGVFRQIFFLFDPEFTHDTALLAGKILGSNPITRTFSKLAFNYSHPSLEQTLLGIRFKNPIGLAAGFDKDAQLTAIIPNVGFGFSEVGSITGEPCKGNPKPRLWRLKKTKGLVVYSGLKNKGCEHIGKSLRRKKFSIPIGISIAKTNCKKTAKLEEGIKDYVKAHNELSDLGDYMTINISCPNAFGGKPFTSAKNLDMLLTELEKVPIKSAIRRPVFLKLAPDLKNHQIDTILKVASSHKIQGFICTNLTKDRKIPHIKKFIEKEDIPKLGGISGKPIQHLSDKTLAYVYKKLKSQRKKYILMGCGGIFTAEDAYRKIRLGANLVQLITGMIFEGPQIVSEINQGLVKLLKKDGFSSIKEAVGVDNK